uniref:Uncharacterized protein n=1 Tax=Triticum urartu TaxID=4572 RepID=A0A8R7TH81_TRIUA
MCTMYYRFSIKNKTAFQQPLVGLFLPTSFNLSVSIQLINLLLFTTPTR